MSKSKGNVVSPDDFIMSYGADTGRVFELFMAPPEKDLEWSDQGVEGAFRFLNRVWRFFQTHRATFTEASARPSDLSAPGRAFRRTIHETIKRVTTDIDEFHFNTAISALHELVMRCAFATSRWIGWPPRAGGLSESIDTLVRLLARSRPTSSRLWERFRHRERVPGVPGRRGHAGAGRGAGGGRVDGRVQRGWSCRPRSRGPSPHGGAGGREGGHGSGTRGRTGRCGARPPRERVTRGGGGPA
jgi:hypothetical protein